MAQYPDYYRPEIERQLNLLTQKKAQNELNISALTSENAIIDEQITLGEATLDFIDSELDQPGITGFSATSTITEQVDITWDDAGPTKTYVIERGTGSANDTDFIFESERYTGDYNPPITDTEPGISGETKIYRIKAVEAGMDDSAWVYDTVLIA